MATAKSRWTMYGHDGAYGRQRRTAPTGAANCPLSPPTQDDRPLTRTPLTVVYQPQQA